MFVLPRMSAPAFLRAGGQPGGRARNESCRIFGAAVVRMPAGVMLFFQRWDAVERAEVPGTLAAGLPREAPIPPNGLAPGSAPRKRSGRR